MRKFLIAAALALATTAALAQNYPCEPARTIDALAAAVQRVAPMFIRPRAAPVETTGAAPAAPPPRDEWKRRLMEGGRQFCAAYPDDEVCRHE